MPSYGQSVTLQYTAWNTSTNAYVTGDSANHTLRWVKDGTASAPTNSPSEVDATNAPGIYKVVLTSTEAQCQVGTLAGKSSTSNVILIGITVTFENLPTASPGAANGVFIAGTNAATTITTALTTTFTGNLTGSVNSVTGNVGGNVVGSTASVTGAVGSVTGNVGGNVVGSVGSVTGAVGSVTGNVGGNVTGSVGSIATGGIASASFASGAITAAAIATGAIDADAIATDAVTELWSPTFSDLSAVPGATASVFAGLNFMYMMTRNKLTQTATTQTLFKDDSATAVGTATVSDDGTTFTRGKLS